MRFQFLGPSWVLAWVNWRYTTGLVDPKRWLIEVLSLSRSKLMSQILKYGWNSTVYAKDKCPAGRSIQEARKNIIINRWKYHYQGLVWIMIHDSWSDWSILSNGESPYLWNESARSSSRVLELPRFWYLWWQKMSGDLDGSQVLEKIQTVKYNLPHSRNRTGCWWAMTSHHNMHIRI